MTHHEARICYDALELTVGFTRSSAEEPVSAGMAIPSGTIGLDGDADQ